MSINNIEMQDSNGNIYHPHTSADVVFGTDGKPISTVAVLTHAKLGTVHTLTGTIPTTGIIQASFKATSDFTEGNTFSINATPYTAKPNGEELTLPDKAFITGDVVTVAVDVEGKKINFRVGGGASVPSIFGDGSDGDLIIRAGQTVTLPVEHPHKDVIIKQYKSILIEATGKLTTAAPNCGLVIKCKGDCTIDGVIDQSGKGGFDNPQINYEYPAIMCGKGGKGGNGGDGGQSNTQLLSRYNIGYGADGGSENVGRVYGGGNSGSGGGAGSGMAVYGIDGTSHSAKSGNNGTRGTGSNDSLSLGGKGGDETNSGYMYGGKGGNGAQANFGGGIILLYIGGALKISGNIVCTGLLGNNGGFGSSGYFISPGGASTVYSGGGGGGGGGASGGGGGGAIYICHNAEYLLTGVLDVSSGMGGIGGDGGVGSRNTAIQRGLKGANGTAGQIGEIKVVKYEKGQTV